MARFTSRVLGNDILNFTPADDADSLTAKIKELQTALENGSGGSGGALVYDTLSQLQTAYPSGSTQPAFIRGLGQWYYWSGNVVNPSPDTTPPINVTGVNATNVTQTGMTIGWTLVSDAVSYEIWKNGSLLTTISSSPYNATGLTANTSYSWVIKAKDSAGNTASGSTPLVQSTLANNVTPPPDTTAPTITVSPQGSVYSSSQTITISLNETGTIYYTLNGTTPTTSSTVYSSPITISSTATLSILAVDSAGNQSTRQDIYTINAPTGTYVNDASLKLFQASPTKGSMIDESSFQYFQGNQDWSLGFTVTMQQATGQSNPAGVVLIRGASASATTSTSEKFEMTYLGKWSSNLYGKKADGTTNEYPAVTDTTAHTTDLPRSFRVQYVLDHTNKKFFLYVDNVLVSTYTSDNTGFTINADANKLYVGSSVNISSISNLTYYNRVLTSAELTQNYNALK